MSHADHTDGRPAAASAASEDTVEVSQPGPLHDDSPISSSWSAVTAPWGTPGNHLTGPIPRIRRREDGSLTHGEES